MQSNSQSSFKTLAFGPVVLVENLPRAEYRDHIALQEQETEAASLPLGEASDCLVRVRVKPGGVILRQSWEKLCFCPVSLHRLRRLELQSASRSQPAAGGEA